MPPESSAHQDAAAEPAWRARLARPWRWLEAHDLVPEAGPTRPWRGLVPAHPAAWISAGLLLILLGVYLTTWVRGHHGYLLDPARQTDDARTLFFLHQYGRAGTMADDPIAREMQDWVPPAVHALYRVIVPVTDLFWATKVVQGLLLLMLLGAAVALARARCGGLAAGVLLLFGALHSAWLIGRLAGGLPRGFAFPCLVLWIAGALARSERLRWAATLIAALTYPSAMALLLGAEGLLLVARRPVGAGWRPLLVGLRRYGLLVGLAGLCLTPYLLGASHRGPTHTLEEARAMPGFKRGGRVALVPLADPVRGFAERIIREYEVQGGPLIAAAQRSYLGLRQAGPLVFLTLLMLLVLLRLAPRPDAALALLGSAVIVYLFARVLALKLYDPSRYYNYGAPAAVLALSVAVVGLVGHGPALPAPWRATLRHGAAALWMLLIWALAGSGIVRHNTLPLNRRTDAALYDFVARLPRSARIATHPGDGDNLPFWAARPTTGGHETFQPWCKGTWRRQVRRFKAVSAALYATRREDLLAYCLENRITHLLLSRRRYGPTFHRWAHFMEPVGRFIAAHLRGVKRSELALARIPPAAIVFQHRDFQLVEVSALERAWAQEPPAPGAGP